MYTSIIQMQNQQFSDQTSNSRREFLKKKFLRNKRFEETAIARWLVLNYVHWYIYLYQIWVVSYKVLHNCLVTQKIWKHLARTETWDSGLCENNENACTAT